MYKRSYLKTMVHVCELSGLGFRVDALCVMLDAQVTQMLGLYVVSSQSVAGSSSSGSTWSSTGKGDGGAKGPVDMSRAIQALLAASNTGDALADATLDELAELVAAVASVGVRCDAASCVCMYVLYMVYRTPCVI